MGKILKDTDRQKLDSIVSQMVANKESDDDIQFVVNDFKSKYSIDESSLKKKVDSQPLGSQSNQKVTQQPSPLKSNGNPSLTGGVLEDYNAKVKEQEQLKKEETAKKLGSLNIDFAKTGLDIKAVGNEIKTKLKDASISEIDAFNEVVVNNTKNNGGAYFGFKQSSIGKANELIDNVRNGIELSQEDEAYLKQTSPKAYNELLNSSNVISVDVNSIARQKKKEQQEAFALSANQDMVNSANELRQIGIDVNNISANKAVQELAKVESVYSSKLNELNTKYPEKIASYTGSQFKDNYQPVVKRDDAYAQEKAELDAQYGSVKEKIGKLNAYQYAIKNKNADVESVGEEVLKVADPIRYNNFVKGGKKSADVKEDLHKLGYHILQSTNDTELVNKGRSAEQEHDNKYPNEVIQETKKRIASEYVKSIGGENYVTNKGSLSIEEADKFIDQLPQKYKKAYLEKIRPYAINQNGITSSISDVNDVNFNPSLYTNKELSPKDASIEMPNLGGAVNKFVQGYTQPIEGVFNFALDRLDSDGNVVNRALEKPKMYEQELAKSKELNDQINQLKSKPKLTVQEATELSQKQQELQVQKPFKDVVDGSFSLLGQVVGQAALSEIGTPFVSTALKGINIGTKAVGFTDKASRIAEYASELKNIKGASASMVAYVSSYSDAEKEAINLGLDGWKKGLYSNVVAGLNAGTERIFKDEKVLDAFNMEVSPLIGDMVQNLTTRGVTEAVLSRELKTIISSTLPKFAKNLVIENQKEAVEELATQLGTSITKGLLAPEQFNTKEELDAMKQVWYETTIYGGLTSFGAAVTETRNSSVSKKAMYELGSNTAEINKFIDVVNTQVSNGKMSQEDANDKIKAVNTMQQIVQKSIPLIDSKRKLTSSEKVKLSNILLAERKLQDEIKNPNYSDVKTLNEKELSKVQDMKDKILNGEVFVDDNLDVYTQDEYNAKRDSELKQQNQSNETATQTRPETPITESATNIGQPIDNVGQESTTTSTQELPNTEEQVIEPNAKVEDGATTSNVQLDEVQSIQAQIDELIAKRKTEYDNAISKKENPSQVLKDIANKKVSAKYNPQIEALQAQLKEKQSQVEPSSRLQENGSEQPNVSNQSETKKELGLKDGDKYTDAKGVERVWGQDVNADKTHEIEQMLKATAEGAAMGATIQSVEDFKAGKETIFRKPQSIEAAKNNPNYNVEIQDDGSAKVIGVLDPRNNEWVGVSAEKSIENKNNSLGEPTVSKVDDGDLYEFKNENGLLAGVMISPTEFRIDGISANETGKGKGSKMFEDLIYYLKDKGVNTISTISAGDGAKAMHQKAVDKGLISKVSEDGRSATFTINTEQQPTTSNQFETPKVEEGSGGLKNRKVYHGADSDFTIEGKKNRIMFTSNEKKYANYYAKERGGNVFEFDIDESKIAKEDYVKGKIKELDLKTTEGESIEIEDNLHRLIDPRFEDTSISKEGLDILFSELEKEGYYGIDFMDENQDLGGKNQIESTAIFNPKEFVKSSKQSLKEQPTTSNQFETPKEGSVNEFQYVIDKVNKGGESVKGSGTKKVNLSDKEATVLNKTIEKLEAKAVGNNGASFDESETINVNYEKVNGKEQKINTYNIDGYEIKYTYNNGKSFTEIRTPQGDLIIVQKQYGKTEVSYLGNSKETPKAETPTQEQINNSIKEIELKRDSDVRELSKDRLEINLPTMKEIVNSKDPIGNKEKYDAIKEKIIMLDKLINCL